MGAGQARGKYRHLRIGDDIIAAAVEQMHGTTDCMQMAPGIHGLDIDARERFFDQRGKARNDPAALQESLRQIRREVSRELQRHLGKPLRLFHLRNAPDA